MAKAGKFSATSNWSDLLKRGEYAVREASGEVYRVQPVDLETFVTSQDYLKQSTWGMSSAQKEFLSAASDHENGVNFFVLFVGKGGGKNWASGILFLYTVYKLLCMYDPHKYLGKGNSDKAITLINVAINSQQAEKNFFAPMVSILNNAGPKAFQEFGYVPGEDNKASVVFPKNIQIISANSKAGGIEGYDVLLALADEVDDSEFYGVDKIVTTLRSSARSRFRGKEKVIVISYRRYIGSSGKIMEYYNSAVGKAHIYARRYASWEFHPVLTREDFESEFLENPEKAACIYESVDSGSFIDSWIKDPKRIKSSMNLNRSWIFDWPLPYQIEEVGTEEWWAKENHGEWKQNPASESSYVDSDGVKQRLDPYAIPIKEYGDSKYQYVFTGDPALGSEANGGDGYGVVLAHREVIKDERGRKFVRPIVDFTFRFTGRMFEEGQVQMAALESLIVSLKEQYGYNIKIFSFDGWNCLAKGSRVLTHTGYKNVEELSVGDYVVGKSSLNKILVTETRDNVPSYRIRTDNGLEIVVTKNHPLYVDGKGFIEAENLSIGDRIVHGNNIFFGSYENIPEATVLGYLVAEGDWNGDIRFSNTEDEVKSDYVSAFKSLYHDIKINTYDLNVRTCDSRLRDKLCDSGAHNKSVPSSIFSGTKAHIGSFLSALYEGDGNVQIESPRKGGQKIKVELTTVSERLSRDVQLLLSQLGIKSYRKYYKNKWLNGKRCPYYRVTISGRQIIPFSESVGFRSRRKTDKLTEAVSKLRHTRKSRFISSAKIVDIVDSTSTIVHMEVSGDNTYIAEGLLNHNSASLAQWIAKTYKDAIVHNANLVTTKDYTALRDCIFGESPPSGGEGKKETNGGIDLPWHPILFEELRNLREDRCFTGDTKVKLLDGTERTLKELAESGEESFWVYSYDQESGEFIPSLATSPRVTYETDKLALVTLDTGEIIKCTPDHKFMTSEGDWVEAKDLESGTSLKHAHIDYKPIHSTKQHLTYETINGKFTHQWVMDSLVIPRDTVHHKNLNRYDNTPVNLTSMSWKEHRELHLSINARHDVTLKRIVDVTEPGDDVYSVARKLNCKPDLVYSRLKYVGGARSFFGKPEVSISRLESEWEFGISQARLSEKTGLDRDTIRRLVGRNWIKFKKEQDRKLIYREYRNGMSLRQLAHKLGCSWTTFYYRIKRYNISADSLLNYNHKISNVSIIDCEPTKMYDITVEGTGNFLLGSSHIIVSNSKNPAKIDHPEGGTKDIADALAKACRIITMDWPFAEVYAAGGVAQPSNIADKVKSSFASEKERKEYTEELNSNAVGMGAWKKLSSERPIRMEDIIPEYNI